MILTATAGSKVLPASVDVSAMVVGALFGAHVAWHRRIPLFGVLLAGTVAGLGGGMTRDVLLGLEPVAITAWYYIPAVLVAAIVGGATAARLTLADLPFIAFQAASVGLLIGIGVQKAVEYRAPAPSAILLGVVAAAFGGAIADVLAGSRATMMREDHWLLMAIVFGAVVFWVCTEYLGFYPAVVITDILVVAFRVLSIRFDWASPVFPGRDV